MRLGWTIEYSTRYYTISIELVFDNVDIPPPLGLDATESPVHQVSEIL